MFTKTNGVYFSFFLVWFGHFLVDFFSGVWPVYKTLANIDIATAGVLLGISGLVGDGSQLFFGYLSDQGHRKKCMLLGVLLASAAVFFPFVETPACFFLLLLCIYVGSGAFHPSAAGLASMLAPRYRAFTMTFFTSGGLLGYALAPFLFTAAFQEHAHGSLFFLVPVIIMCVMLVRYRLPVAQQASADRIQFKGAWRLFAPYWKVFGALYFSQVFVTGSYFAMIFLLPDLLLARGYPQWVVFGGSQVCLTMASFLFAVPLGYFSDRVSHNQMLKINIFISLILFYTLLFANALPIGALLALLFCIGASMGLINPLLVAFGTRLMSERISTVSALLMGSAWCLSHLGPLTAGMLTTVFEVDAAANALKVMGIYIVFAACLMMTLPRLAPVRAEEKAAQTL